MEIEELVTNVGMFLFAYVLGANCKQYNMARDWMDAHPKCDISFYDDWIHRAKYFNKLNFMNTCVGSLGRKIAYKIGTREQ